MPVRGQTMHNCFDGELEQVIFLEESLADPSCTITTYLLQRLNGEKFRCSKDMYVESEEEARQKYLEECRKALPQCKKQLTEIQEQIAFIEHEMVRTQIRLDDIRDRKARQQAFNKSS